MKRINLWHKKYHYFLGGVKYIYIFANTCLTTKFYDMRKTLFMLLACLFCAFAQAQTKVEVRLTDGKVVKGTTRTLFSVDDANSIKVKDAKGEKKTYKSTEVKNLRVYDAKSQKWYTFEALKAQKALPNVWNKNPKPYSDPVFLQVVYEGKNSRDMSTTFPRRPTLRPFN